MSSVATHWACVVAFLERKYWNRLKAVSTYIDRLIPKQSPVILVRWSQVHLHWGALNKQMDCEFTAGVTSSQLCSDGSLWQACVGVDGQKLVSYKTFPYLTKNKEVGLPFIPDTWCISPDGKTAFLHNDHTFAFVQCSTLDAMSQPKYWDVCGCEDRFHVAEAHFLTDMQVHVVSNEGLRLVVGLDGTVTMADSIDVWSIDLQGRGQFLAGAFIERGSFEEYDAGYSEWGIWMVDVDVSKRLVSISDMDILRFEKVDTVQMADRIVVSFKNKRHQRVVRVYRHVDLLSDAPAVHTEWILPRHSSWRLSFIGGPLLILRGKKDAFAFFHTGTGRLTLCTTKQTWRASRHIVYHELEP